MADETVRNSYDSNYRDPNWRDEDADATAHDDIQHGIDDSPTHDAEKGAAMGGIGGAVTGAIAGSMTGPGGAVLGAVIGGVAGAVASGAAVGAIDRVDNDNTVSGIGGGTTPEKDSFGANEPTLRKSWDTTANDPYVTDTTEEVRVDGTTDTRGVWEKAEDAVTGDKYDDKTGRRIA